MKQTQILTFSAIFLFCSLCMTGSVVAVEKEAGMTATLAMHALSSEKLPGDPRIHKLSAYLKKWNSPLLPYAETFVKEADKQDLDWRLVASIAGLESSFGKHIPFNSYNPFGWGVFDGQNYGVNFKNWEDGIATVSQGLREKYVNDGLLTVEQIGRRYASSPTWAPRIRFFMEELEKVQPSLEKPIAMTL